MDLSTARVLVTGGSAGIGFATARALKARGAAVAICGRDRARLEAAAEALGATGIQADVSHEADVELMAAEVVSELGGFDVLVNNAAFGYFAKLTETELEPFEAMLRTNLTGAMLVARAAARHFVEQGYGHLVNVGSTAAQRGFPGGTAYVASKFALRGMTECWRAELRPHDIRVMEIDPSEVLTGFGGREPPQSERKLRPTEIAHAIVAMLEMDDRGFVTDLTVWATNPD
ncbi:MAG: SDR family oxidoreductase [Planctomycetota bacterium]|jgi:3-oxoacyl-[acyl-carrier protein] reductase